MQNSKKDLYNVNNINEPLIVPLVVRNFNFRDRQTNFAKLRTQLAGDQFTIYKDG